MERWLGDSSLQAMLKLVQHHEASYHSIQHFIDKPPGKLRIVEIYPPKPLSSMALGSRLPALRDDYKMGRLCGRYFLATVGKLLAERPPLHRHQRIITPATMVVPPAVVANDVVATPLVVASQANNTLFNNEDLA